MFNILSLMIGIEAEQKSHATPSTLTIHKILVTFIYYYNELREWISKLIKKADFSVF